MKMEEAYQNLGSDKSKETEEKQRKEKKKTFEDFFPIRTITKCYAIE